MTSRAIYKDRLAALDSAQSADKRRERLAGYTKLLLAFAALCLSPFLIRSPAGGAALGGLVLAFLLFLVLHEKLLNRIRARGRSIGFYQRGLARMNGEWQGGGERGEQFLDASHPYARDLDLFGEASVFQYICDARTKGGEAILASWLLHPSQEAEVTQRQEAVRELAWRVELREQIYTAGEQVRSSADPGSLTAWGEALPVLSTVNTRATASVLAALWIVGVIAWAFAGEPLPALLMTVLNFAFAHRIHTRSDRAAEHLERTASELRVTASLLKLAETTAFQAHLLRQLQNKLKAHRVCPSELVRRLGTIAELIQSRHSLFLRPLDLVLFWSAQLIFVSESWQRSHGPHIREWMEVVGEFEALASLAAFAFEHPSYAYPTFTKNGPRFEAQELAHPLLGEHAITNSVRFDPEHALIVLSGPNMAGKSTFIRSIGVNAVLAQCGAPVRASSLVLSRLQVAASICVLDSLSGGVSRFYAEIRRLKLIDNLTAGTVPVLFLLDELLSGTNSSDRFAGTDFVLRTFVDRHAIGIVSTHDLALTRIPDELGGMAENAHFEDRLEGGKLVFDYRLKPGVVQTSNALSLMRAVGFGVPDSLNGPPVK